MDRYIRLLVFLQIAIYYPLKHWPLIWVEIKKSERKRIKRRNYLRAVFLNCTLTQQHAYKALTIAKDLENIPHFEGGEHSKGIREANTIKKDFEINFWLIRQLLPAFNEADKDSNPCKMIAFLNSSAIKILERSTPTCSDN